MSNLISVPWQPGYKLTPDTLAYLVDASRRLGSNIYLTDAWRSYQAQKRLRTGYEQGLPGFNYASDPDDPKAQNNHMRGAAFDTFKTDAATQAACRAAGLVRDANESWHWNNPNWPNMPIIPSDDGLAPAGGNSTPIRTPEEIFMDDATFKSDTNATVYLYLIATGTVRTLTGPEYTMLQRANPTLKTAVLSTAETSAIVNGHLVDRAKGR